jgi:hypothetical protein
MIKLTHPQRKAVLHLLEKLIHQENAEIIIPAKQAEPGYWFGGGKLAIDAKGIIWLSGRYRNAGDSRTGLEAGVRGAECTIFRSKDQGTSFQKIQSWEKKDFAAENKKIISIEGTALHQTSDGRWELFVSSEKDIPYPDPVSQFQKPGTGVWSIDRITGTSPDSLDIRSQETILENLSYPAYLHIKDPVVYNNPQGNSVLIFCSHPYSWSSDNSGYATRSSNEQKFTIQEWEMVSRGATWDVAVTRITSRLAIPRTGIFADTEPISVYFYDGAECMRSHPENIHAPKRPRGYSCEELGGAFIGWDKLFPDLVRLSELEPMFTSPWGTGSSRYVDCLVTQEGILAVWQQSQTDGSQPLVRNFLPMEVVNQILSSN